jgi:hypothetical protein
VRDDDRDLVAVRAPEGVRDREPEAVGARREARLGARGERRVAGGRAQVSASPSGSALSVPSSVTGAASPVPSSDPALAWGARFTLSTTTVTVAP